MIQFRHPHIIKLIGICSIGPPTVWIIMELVALGELRGYLHREKICIDLSVQIIFAHQIASALTYLHERQYLHRDVAARNCLVANPHCVKLSDFGLSRRLNECEDVYTGTIILHFLSNILIIIKKINLVLKNYSVTRKTTN